jgi:elongation factor Ts
MAEITAALVKELREKTGAGMLDCKKALEETGGNMDKAMDLLREKGLATAAKKASRVAAEGVVYAYIHGGGRVGVLLELNCETDFVAKGDDFKALAHEIALQIAAMKPQYLKVEDVPADVIAHEREVERARAIEEGKPESKADMIAEGRIKKWLSEVVLLEQAWVKDDKKKIADLVKEAVARIGENITIRRFTRYEVGEGIEKKADDFAAEVAKMAGQ